MLPSLFLIKYNIIIICTYLLIYLHSDVAFTTYNYIHTKIDFFNDFYSADCMRNVIYDVECQIYLQRNGEILKGIIEVVINNFST